MKTRHQQFLLFLCLLVLFLSACGSNKKKEPTNVEEHTRQEEQNKNQEMEQLVKQHREYQALRLKEDEEYKEKMNRGFKLYAMGDIMFHSPQLRAGYKDGKYDFYDSFIYVENVIKDGLSIANLETTIREDGFSGFPLFRTPKIVAENLKDAGFDILGLANNHALDGKKEGVFMTKQAVEEAGITALGTYVNKDIKPLIYELENRKIAFLNYTYGLNGLDGWLGEDQYLINRLDEERVEKDIEYAKEHAQGIIVLVHWGTEYKIGEPDAYQEKWAKFFVDHGVDVILGSHPHVIEKDVWFEEEGHKTYCIYSMGNFISNQRREYMDQPYGEDGVIVELDIIPKGDRIEVEKVKYHPTWVKRTEQPLGFQILPVEMGLSGLIPELTEKDKARLEESEKRTRSILTLERE